MKASISYIEQKFEEYNQLCFAGQLPKLPVELSDAKSFLGVCVYKKRKNRDGKTEYYDFRLRINTRIELPEADIEDTIIHEMIHYFIGYKQLEDVSSHGPMFQHLMNSINEKYGRHVTISHKCTEEQNEQAYDTRPHWHVVAVVSFHDGRTGIKVLPRVVERIISFFNGVANSRDVSSVNLYLSNDIFFNRFPNSSALNVRFIESEILDEHLKGAEVIECDGKDIITQHKKESTATKSTKPQWHVIAVLSLYDGKKGVKVLPRIVERIVTFYNEMGKMNTINNIELYMSNNIFFQQFPNSASHNFHYVEEEIITDNLKGAERIICDGKSIIRKK